MGQSGWLPEGSDMMACSPGRTERAWNWLTAMRWVGKDHWGWVTSRTDQESSKGTERLDGCDVIDSNRVSGEGGC